MMKSTFTIAMVQGLVASLKINQAADPCGNKVVKWGAREVEFSRIEAELGYDAVGCFLKPDSELCETTDTMLDSVCIEKHSDEFGVVDLNGTYCADRDKALRDFEQISYFYDLTIKAELDDEECGILKADVMNEYKTKAAQKLYLSIVATDLDRLSTIKEQIECTDCVNRVDPLVDNGFQPRRI